MRALNISEVQTVSGGTESFDKIDFVSTLIGIYAGATIGGEVAYLCVGNPEENFFRGAAAVLIKIGCCAIGAVLGPKFGIYFKNDGK